MKDNRGKYLLKKAMKPYLPVEIIDKKKVGLEIPYSIWLCNELKEMMLDNLSDQNLSSITFLNQNYIHEIIRQHLSRKKDNGRELWGLMNFVAWYMLYFA